MSSGGRIEPQEGGLIDPSYLEQLSILNQLQTQAAPMQQQMLGSGLINAVAGGGGGLMIPDYRPQAQKFRQDLTDIFNATNQGGGGGVDFNSNDGFGTFSGRAPAPLELGIVQTVNPDGTLTANAVTSPVIDYGPVVGTPLGPLGGDGGGGFDGTSSGPFGGISEGFDGSPSAPSANVGDQEGFDGSPSDGGGGGGGGGGCCFIMLEARYGDGAMDTVVRKYRDEMLTERNRAGYYKLAHVLVPLMRASRVFKFLVQITFSDPLVSYGRWYYKQNKHGWLFAPIKTAWMNVFDILGADTQFVREKPAKFEKLKGY